ncbi:hypothetical protein [Nitrosophilus alvini]|uniref:hypothetical protein n=1 Tax=Nitrosophilus alvini TaxID=2714855 RepID=UPI00190AD961|nr:hypothetical protein [Nitrosophilus alvini]
MIKYLNEMIDSIIVIVLLFPVILILNILFIALLYFAGVKLDNVSVFIIALSAIALYYLAAIKYMFSKKNDK